MTADEVLLQVIAAGLTVALDNGKLVVRPKAQLTDELRGALLAQRAAVEEALAARSSMPAIVAPVPPRPCTECEQLHAGVYCLHYQMPSPEPTRPYRCVAFVKRQPVLPWG